MSDICSICSTVFREGSLDDYHPSGIGTCPWDWSPFKGRIATSYDWSPLHGSRQDYEEGLARDCKLCRLIATIAPADRSEISTSFLLVKGQGDQDCDRLWIVDSSDAAKLPNPSKALCFNLWPTTISQEAVGLHQLAVEAGASQHTGSSQALQLASQWLRECRTNHQRCVQHLRTTWYPTRLLEIVGETVKLILTSKCDTRGPYCTLSHCWGKVPPRLKLTLETQRLLEDGVMISSLEQTYQDAILAADFLGIRYIWIDIFCIIQGHDQESHQDWKKESITMDRVYAESVLNLGAAGGSDSHSGCFCRLANPAHAPSIVIPWARCHGDQPMYYELLRADHENDDKLEHFYESSPIFSRGWITQERILAPRMLHFAAQGLLWECAEGVATQQRPYVTKNNAKDSPRPLPGRLATPSSINSRSRWIILWCRAVRTYSKAQLTDPSMDKLVAIHGIGTRIADLLDEALFFGFLASTLPWSLCWKSEPTSEVTSMGGRVENERFPSWHFARLNTWVLMPRGGPRFWGQGFGKRCVKYLMCLLDNSYLDPSLPTAPKHLCCIAKIVCLTIQPEKAQSEDLERPNEASFSRQHSIHLKKSALPFESKRTVISSVTASDDGDFWVHLDHECTQSDFAKQLWFLLPVYISEPRSGSNANDDGHCAGLVLQRLASGDLVRRGIFQGERKGGKHSVHTLLNSLQHIKPEIVMLA